MPAEGESVKEVPATVIDESGYPEEASVKVPAWFECMSSLPPAPRQGGSGRVRFMLHGDIGLEFERSVVDAFVRFYTVSMTEPKEVRAWPLKF